MTQHDAAEGKLDDERWSSHLAMHERDRQVLADTAARLATSVDNTRKALETQVENTKLALVGQADLHARNHDREHAAHERIHTVEKQQVDRERETINDRLNAMNEFRDQLRDQAATFVRTDFVDLVISRMDEKLDAGSRAQALKVDALEKQFVEYREAHAKFSSEQIALLGQAIADQRASTDSRFAVETGKKTGALDTRTLVFSLVAAFVGVGGIILAFVASH